MNSPSSPSIAELYAEIRESSQPLDQSVVRGMSNQLKYQTVLSALGIKTPRNGSIAFAEWIRNEGAFPLHTSVQNPEGRPDFIFSNHQGPGEERNQETDRKKGMGILDTSLSLGIDPAGTRNVLKKEIVDYLAPKSDSGSIMKSVAHAIRARMVRRSNPIPLQRPTNEEFEQDTRAAVKRLLEECERVWEECCGIVNSSDRSTVKIYPEGTRSSDGDIGPMNKGLCFTLIQKYIHPRLQSNMLPNMELEIVDTLQTFPDGLGSSVPGYNRPLTINRYTYIPDASLMTDIGEWNGESSTLRDLRHELAKDMRSQMKKLLRGIIMESV
jgi:hypothetical protein